MQEGLLCVLSCVCPLTVGESATVCVCGPRDLSLGVSADLSLCLAVRVHVVCRCKEVWLVFCLPVTEGGRMAGRLGVRVLHR